MFCLQICRGRHQLLMQLFITEGESINIVIKLRFIPVITEVGNKRSKIFHVMRGQNHRMNRENAVFFKSKAAARAAGYRESKR